MALIYTDPVFLEHETGTHPECPARLRQITLKLEQAGTLERFTPGKIRSATPAELALVHDADYIASLAEFATRGGGRLDNDTLMCGRSFDVAVRAAGTAIDAVEQVVRGPHRQAMCLIRPPGHHALQALPMGFCLFNNAAVAAQYALDILGLNRVLIIDWDVHHGNGTQDIFYDSSQVYFFSAHRFPFWPGTGRENETGTGAGLGTNFNLPLAFGISRREYLTRFETQLTDAAARCKPDLVVLSAGFDAHHADPIGSLGLETEDFGALTKLVQQVADHYCGGRLVSLLEGGYNLQALAESVQCHLETLAPAK